MQWKHFSVREVYYSIHYNILYKRSPLLFCRLVISPYIEWKTTIKYRRWASAMTGDDELNHIPSLNALVVRGGPLVEKTTQAVCGRIPRHRRHLSSHSIHYLTLPPCLAPSLPVFLPPSLPPCLPPCLRIICVWNVSSVWERGVSEINDLKDKR